MITEALLRQIRKLLEPMKIRLANSIASAVVENVSDAKKMQILQISVLDGEVIEDAQRFQEYGFNSVPFAQAEAVVVFPNGDRENALVVAVDDRRYRPTDWDEGDAGIYNSSGAVVRLKGADIEVNPGAGGKVYIRSDGGSSEPVVGKTEFMAHLHTSAAAGSPTSTPTVAIVGTAKLEAE